MSRKRWPVQVTAEDFAFGEPRDSNRCAVKLAVERSITGAKRVEVDLQTVRFSLKGERHVFLTPWQVAEYVIAFDAGDEDRFQPFAFELRAAVEIGSKVQRREFTDGGKKVEAARTRVRKAEAKKERAVETVNDPDSTPVERAQAEELLGTIDDLITQLKVDLEELRQTAEKPRQKRVASDLPRPPRRAKTRTRNFGMRELRVNQAEGRMHVT